MRTLSLVLLTAVLLSYNPVLGYQEDTESIVKRDGFLDLQSLIDLALMENLEISAQRSRIDAFKTRIQQSGAWKDPKLNFNIMNVPVSDFGFANDPMSQKQISVMQNIPLPGITTLKKKIAEDDVSVEGFRLSEIKRQVIKEVSLHYFDLFLVDKKIEIADKSKAIIENLIMASRKKYEVGSGLQQDVLQAQIEYNKLQDKLLALASQRSVLVAKINNLINRAPGSELAAPPELEHNPLTLNTDELSSAALSDEPALKMLNVRIQQSDTEFALAKKQYWPSVDIGLGYSQRSDRRDLISAQFSIALPVWQNRKQDRKIEETQFRKLTAEKLYADKKNSINENIAILLAKLNESDERINLLREVIIPQADQSLNSEMAGYRVNKVDFVRLLDSQKVLLDLETDYYRLITDYKKSLATLEFVIGRRIGG